MAIISKIRNNSWILIFFIGLGLAGFLMMDMFSGDTGVMSSANTAVGSVNGITMESADLNRRESIWNFIYGNQSQNTYETKDYLWNHMVEEKIMKQKAEALGLGVSREELMELQFGENLSPIIEARFSDPNTRQLNRQNLNEVKNAIESNQINGDYRAYWAYQESEIIKQQLEDKYQKMVTQAIYTPTWLAEYNNEMGSKTRQIAYAQLPFDLSNLNVEISDSDISSYIQENKSFYFKEKENRKLVVLDIPVRATRKDTLDILNKITAKREEMKTTEDLDLFVERNEGLFDEAYFLKSELNAGSADSIFGLSEGEIYGPYMENGAYQMVKMVDRMTIPDSVKARHILIRVEGSSLAQAESTVDSLKNLIETGQNSFDSLAVTFGTDGTASKGGDLGFSARGGMVKPFNDLIFYKAEKGKLYSVTTQYGVHLVEVTDRKYIENEEAIRLALIGSPIVPSEETQDKLYESAQKIMRDHRDVASLREFAASDASLILSDSDWFNENNYTIESMADPVEGREAVRWAFKEGVSVNDVSDDVLVKEDKVNFFNSNYYIIGLVDVMPAGLPTADKMRSTIEPILLNEKKGEDLKSNLSGKRLEEISSNYNAKLDTITGVSVSTPFIPKLGSEGKLIGKVSSMNIGEEAVVVGKSGVYAFKVLDIREGSTSVESFKSQRKALTGSTIRNTLMGDIKKQLEIEDNRATFY